MAVRKPEQPGPSDSRSATTVQEFLKAAIWIGLSIAVALFFLLIQPLLLMFAAPVFAAIPDGGTRLLDRVLPIGSS